MEHLISLDAGKSDHQQRHARPGPSAHTDSLYCLQETLRSKSQEPVNQPESGHEAQDNEEETLPPNHFEATLPLQRTRDSVLDVDERIKNTETRLRQKKSAWRDTWLLETLSMVFSLACFAAICILLKICDNKPRPNFSSDISLNAILSVLSTACKSALAFVVGEAIGQLKWVWFQDAKAKHLVGMQTFDSASRGPLGSLSIIFSHKGQTVVSFGAATVVLMLAFDPFFQQVLSYPTRSTVLGPQAGFANTPQAYQISMETNETELASGTLLGLWSNEFSVQPSCSSGNCSWPIFPSVGICSRCVDMTATASMNCTTPSDYNPQQKPSFTNSTCEVVFPRGLTSKTSISLTATEAAGYLLVEAPYLMAWKLYDSSIGTAGDSFTFGNLTNPMVAYGYAQLGYDHGRVTESSEPASGTFIKKATECSLTRCLRYYDTSVESGIAVIKTTDTDYGKSSFHQDGSYRWTPESSKNTKFDVVSLTEYFFSDAFDFYIPNKAYGLWAYWNSSTTEESFGTDGGWFGWADSSSASIPILLRMQSSSFETIIGNVADSWTKPALQTSEYSVNGTVHSSEVFVSVEWLWLTLPALMVMFGAVFLSATVMVSDKVQAPLWKSSVLAYLYHGLRDVEDEEIYQTVGSMEMSAELKKVHLQVSGQNDRLFLG